MFGGQSPYEKASCRHQPGHKGPPLQPWWPLPAYLEGACDPETATPSNTGPSSSPSSRAILPTEDSVSGAQGRGKEDLVLA